MALLTRDEARTILEKVLAYSQANTCEANLNGSVGGNIRYARNTVTTSGANTDAELAVQSSYGKRSGIATINEFDDASLEKVVRRSEELAKLAPENPEFMPPLGPQEYLETKTHYASTARITPEYRAEAALGSIVPSRENDLVAAGFLEDEASFAAMMNTEGLFAYNQSTGVDFTVTVRSKDGTGSGYALRDFNDVDKLDTSAVSQIAIEKALGSREPRAVEPGKYTVILEPAASVGLLQNMLFNMNARTADEGRSFLSKEGGGTKLGEKIVDERITAFSDPQHPEVPFSPWTGEGLAQKPTTWIENGVVKNLFYSRYWAEQKGVEPLPFPGSIVMKGGDASLDELIASTTRGILVTRTWYIRSVDPQTLLYTGLTRDGTFFVENGKIAFPVKNFRFNESPVIMLNNLETLGAPQRINGSLIPPMKIRDFTFSSLSDAV